MDLPVLKWPSPRHSGSFPLRRTRGRRGKMRFRDVRWGVLGCTPMWSLLTLLLAAQSQPPGTDFSREVRPILAEHCFSCHGPDAAARKANLRLDVEGDATRDRGGYSVIDREAAEESELLLRLDGDGVLERMPPESEEPLSDEERRVL